MVSVQRKFGHWGIAGGFTGAPLPPWPLQERGPQAADALALESKESAAPRGRGLGVAGLARHCLLRNLRAGQEQTGSNLRKEYVKAVYCHPAYLTYMQSTSCEMLGWMKHKLESRFPGEISITSDTQMTPPVWQKAKRTKEHLVESERGE